MQGTYSHKTETKFYAGILVSSVGLNELDLSAQIQANLLPSPKSIKLMFMIMMISIIIQFNCIQ
jgi:hypothetical protein